jgi:hypothetical protein
VCSTTAFTRLIVQPRNRWTSSSHAQLASSPSSNNAHAAPMTNSEWVSCTARSLDDVVDHLLVSFLYGVVPSSMLVPSLFCTKTVTHVRHVMSYDVEASTSRRWGDHLSSVSDSSGTPVRDMTYATFLTAIRCPLNSLTGLCEALVSHILITPSLLAVARLPGVYLFQSKSSTSPWLTRIHETGMSWGDVRVSKRFTRPSAPHVAKRGARCGEKEALNIWPSCAGIVRSDVARFNVHCDQSTQGR